MKFQYRGRKVEIKHSYAYAKLKLKSYYAVIDGDKITDYFSKSAAANKAAKQLIDAQEGK